MLSRSIHAVTNGKISFLFLRLSNTTSEWTPGVGDGQGGLACYDSWGRRVGHDWATDLIWSDLNITFWASHMVLIVKNQSASARDIREAGSISGSGRSRGGGHGNPLQYSCLEKPKDRGAWWATIHMVAQSLYTTEVIQHTCMYNITFYLLNNQSIYLYIYIYHTFFIHSSIDGHFSCL